jgi:succinoglycan biosynthesis protein ExoL
MSSTISASENTSLDGPPPPASTHLKAFFVLSRAEHARMWRRVLHLRPYFASSTVAAFERHGHPVNHPHSYIRLGRFSNARFLERIPSYWRTVRSCLPGLRQSDVGYAFSLDILLMLALLRCATRSKARLVYEVADIHPALTGRTLTNRIARLLERVLLRRCCAVVLTSRAFGEGYFRQVQRLPNLPTVVIEHKVSLPPSVRHRITFRPPLPDRLVIGYMGLMKSPASFEILTRLAAAAHGRVEVHFHGRFNDPLNAVSCQRIVDASPHLTYHGPYRSPDDLEKVYGGTDLVWDAYFEGDNARWQRTTRFSEACYFKRPILFNPATEDGTLAARYDLGLPVTFDEPDATIQRILAITEADLTRWFHNLENLPSDFVFYGREYPELIELIARTRPETALP